MIVLLDSGPLGRLTSPKASAANAEYQEWLRSLIVSRVRVLVPEICDYEVRRELIRRNSAQAIKLLDGLRNNVGFLPLNTLVMLRAAELWAEARRTGQPTAPDPAIDADVILAAQALSVNGIIATENVKHLSRFCDAKFWKDITPP